MKPNPRRLQLYLTSLALLLAVLLSGCISTPQADAPEIRQLTILYTNDEHGWMEGMEEGQGAANLLGLWRDREGYTQTGDFLVLSGGDNWTGPAISTWFDGESMVEVMNAMGYTASVIGNHEFDFGLEAIQTRIAQADFPYLSANIRNKSDGKVPVELGIQPYTVLDLDGLKVGLTGLTTTLTPGITNGAITGGFDFIDYEQALREVVPQMRQDGADLILVPGHLCIGDLFQLGSQVQDLDITMLGGGHCNELVAREVGNTVVLIGGYHYTSYAYARLDYNMQTGEMVKIDYGVRQNQGGEAHPEVAAVVARWKDESEAELNKPIGYLERSVERRSQEMAALITESWLIGYPSADVAITNWGGMRDEIRAGEVTLADLISVMPFDNVLVDVRLSGSELLRAIRSSSSLPAIGGMTQVSGGWVLDKTGKRLVMDAEYSVLITDFLYAGGDGFGLFETFDPDAYNTAIDWRQPVIDWILAQDSSAANPLDPAIEELN